MGELRLSGVEDRGGPPHPGGTSPLENGYPSGGPPALSPGGGNSPTKGGKLIGRGCSSPLGPENRIRVTSCSIIEY